MLEQLIREMVEREGRKEIKILPEGTIAQLREALPRFQGENPWKPGDIVTARKDAPFKGHGEPRIVVRVGDNLARSVPEEGSWNEGCNNNVEIIGIPNGEHIVPHVVPHWALEAYRPS